MLGNFGSVGWDNMPEDYGSGGSQRDDEEWQKERLYKFRFKMDYCETNKVTPQRPVTHRVLILDAAPFCFWEHGLFKYRHNTKLYNAICPKKNGIQDECPLCENETWPRFMGMLSVIDMGQVEYKGQDIVLHHRSWKDKKGEIHETAFERKMLAAARGNPESPGPLMHLQWESERRGGTLEGTVWDATRTAKKEDGVGAKWDYVDRIAPEEYITYLQKFGAEPDINVKTIDEEYKTPDKTGWANVCQLVSVEDLKTMVTGRSEPSGYSGGGKGSVEGAGYGGTVGADGDDIPF